MRTLVTKLPLLSSPDGVLSQEQLNALGDLCFDQLVELRHRGAFSTVAQTFVVVAEQPRGGVMTRRNTITNWYQVSDILHVPSI